MYSGKKFRIFGATNLNALSPRVFFDLTLQPHQMNVGCLMSVGPSTLGRPYSPNGIPACQVYVPKELSGNDFILFHFKQLVVRKKIIQLKIFNKHKKQHNIP